eukprot:TRINITY_DN774133_c0_g1_i1.p1 TRINITY_DN774133_c0_g1~~TRINITY_DN774133_c0_g1_i1.p1  ORF type:complete len:551 (-),score=158.18 TRINITY_DN774133_c0_g1_i1:276-1928(-)
MATVAHTNVILTNKQVLRNPLYNKGTAFTEEERKHLHLTGLLPPAVQSWDLQAKRALAMVRSKTTPLEKYIFLSDLQDRDEDLFFKVLIENVKELMPIVYTPTVGEACQKFSHILRHPRGLFISIKDKGHIAEILANHPQRDIAAIVFTDGERILGLGDQGAGGMGIPIGKLSLYTACAGVNPAKCLPVTIDVGTNRETLLEDEMYIGLKQNRVRGAEYDELIDEFIMEAQKRWGEKVLLQFEDFGNLNAFRLLETYRTKCCTFNDDIQGTASVVVGGLYASIPVTGKAIDQHKFLFMGAGEAGVGIADLIAAAIMETTGKTIDEARKQIFLFDSRGLVCKSRTGLAHHKLAYAHDVPQQTSFLEAIKEMKPTGIIGVSATPDVFTEDVCTEMGKLNERPIIFALSNPTHKAECTPTTAYTCTQGRALYASGSPFDPVEYEGKTLIPGQGNNAYVFPGLALGVIAAGAKRIPDELFLIASKALAEKVTEEHLSHSTLYPPLNQIRSVSAYIAMKVAEKVYDLGLATIPRPDDILAAIESEMYDASEKSFI